jgi:hypothetical protein
MKILNASILLMVLALAAGGAIEGVAKDDSNAGA